MRSELQGARRLLVFAYADLHRTICPIVLAQDAQGSNNQHLGGWGLGWARLPPSEVVELCLRLLSTTVPKQDLESVGPSQGLGPGLNDLQIPTHWTDGTVSWYDLLARAHSYHEQ